MIDVTSVTPTRPNPEPTSSTDVDQVMPKRPTDWSFGPYKYYCAADQQWYERAEPTVDRWLLELEEARDPWWQSAEHAASCLVSSMDFERSWEGFSVATFLFRYMCEGGTAGTYGSVEVFFDHLVEAMRRFGTERVVPPSRAVVWCAQMTAARRDFIRIYDSDCTEKEQRAIMRKYFSRPWENHELGAQLHEARGQARIRRRAKRVSQAVVREGQPWTEQPKESCEP